MLIRRLIAQVKPTHLNSSICFNQIPKLLSSSVRNYSKQDNSKTSQFHDSKFNHQDNIWTIPNGLCIIRILSSPLIAFTIITNKPVESLILFTFAGLTDLADGYIARNFKGQKSVLGSILDPVADKILVSTLFISLTISGQLPILLTSIVIARDIGLILGGAILRYKSLPRPRTLTNFFNPKLTTIEISPSLLSKWNTALQLLLIGSTLLVPILDFNNSHLLTYLQYLVAVTTISSGLNYAVSKNVIHTLTSKH